MKNLISILLILALILMTLVACGASYCSDETTTIKAIIELPDGTIIKGTVDSYTRWSESNTEIVINGITYCVHPVNVAFIEE